MIDSFDRYYVDLKHATASDILGRLADEGLVTFGGVATEADALALAESIGCVRMHRDSAANGVTHIAANEGGVAEPGRRGFTTNGLVVHTDRSAVAEPPSGLLFWCQDAGKEGGEALFADGKYVYEKMQAYDREVLEAISTPKSAVFASDEQLYQGAIYERRSDGRLVLRFRSDELLYVSTTVARALPVFRGCLDALTLTMKLSSGMGYVLQNTRWLHGRRPFSGPRRCGRLLLDPKPRAEFLAGFEEPCAA